MRAAIRAGRGRHAGSSQCYRGGISAENCNRRTIGLQKTIKVSLETEFEALSKYIGGRRSTPPRRAIFFKKVARSLGNRARAWLCALFRAPEATTGAAMALPSLIWRLGRTQGGTCVYPSGVEAAWPWSSYGSFVCSCVLALPSVCVLCLMGAAMAPLPWV